MTDKLEPLNMHGHANTWEEELLETAGEIERLRTELHRVAESRRGQRERAERAEAENERLRAVAQAVIDSINDENEIDADAIFRLSKVLDRDS